MKKIEFNELIKEKSEIELTRILNKYTNDLISLTNSQVNRVIKLKEKLRLERRKQDVQM